MFLQDVQRRQQRVLGLPARAAGCGAEASCPGNFLLHTLASGTEIQGLLMNQSHLWNDDVLKVLFVSCLFDFNITPKE